MSAAAGHRGTLAVDLLEQTVFRDRAFDVHAPSDLQEVLVRSQYRHHLERCAPFSDFVLRRRPDVDAVLRGAGTLDDLPLLPVGAFKMADLCSLPPGARALSHTSSGTSGTRSVVARDSETMMRLLGSVEAGLSLLGEWREEDVSVLNLGLPHERAGDVWFAYVMSLVELLYASTSTMDVVEAATSLHHALGHWETVFVVGPPFLVRDLCDHLCATGRTVAGDRVRVVTAGGWKTRHDHALRRDDLLALLRRALGVAEDRYCDAFNQVELNSVLFECSAHQKHVPPWVRARARHPRDLAVAPLGEEGLLSFMDASSTSYPAFFVGDDVGTVVGGTCGCGRTGERVHVSRRVSTRVLKGCSADLADVALAEAGRS